jgi:hypothetical protein
MEPTENDVFLSDGPQPRGPLFGIRIRLGVPDDANLGGSQPARTDAGGSIRDAFEAARRELQGRHGPRRDDLEAHRSRTTRRGRPAAGAVIPFALIQPHQPDPRALR